jgi:hypothetical protein
MEITTSITQLTEMAALTPSVLGFAVMGVLLAFTFVVRRKLRAQY